MGEKVVDVPGVGTVSFPDTMSDDDIATQIRKNSPAAAPQAPEQRSIGGFLGNIIPSAGRLAGNTVQAVTHPFDTVNAIGDAVGGGLQKLSGNRLPPDLMGTGTAQDQSGKFDSAFRAAITDRYGSAENFKNTLYKDPVGVLADISALAGGAGGLARGVAGVADAAGAARTASVAGSIGRGAGAVAEATNPLTMPGRAIGAGLAKTGVDGSKIAQDLYQGSLKPRGSLEDAQKAVQTGIANRIPVSEGGYRKLQALTQDLNNKIAAKIKAGAAQGATVDPNAVATRVDQIRSRYANQVNPKADLNTIDAAKQEFLQAQGQGPAIPPKPSGVLDAHGRPIMTPGSPATPAQPIPLDQAQALKVGTYRQLGDKSYGELSSAHVEAQKALARGLREEIGTQFPEVADLNAKDSRLIGLQDSLEAAVKRIGNKDVIPIANPAHLLKSIIDSPNVKSRLAIAIDSAAKRNPTKFGASSVANALSRVNDYSGQLNPAQ